MIKEKDEDISELIGLNEESVDIELPINEEEIKPEASEIKQKRKYVWKGDKKRKRSEEHNEKIKNALTGRVLSEEHRASISEAMMGNQNFR
jgi:hypothetical protein